MNSNYIYILLKEGKPLYIGKTKNLHRRLLQHSKDKWWFFAIDKILYFEFDNKTDMDIYEIYYINKYMPPFNSDVKNKESFSHELPNIEFKELSVIEFIKFGLNSNYNKSTRPIIHMKYFELDDAEVIREYKKSDFEINNNLIRVKFTAKTMDLYDYVEGIKNGFSMDLINDYLKEKLIIQINNQNYRYINNLAIIDGKLVYEPNDLLLDVINKCNYGGVNYD